MSRSDSGLEAEIDRLYALPLGDFVAARNALAARLKAEKRGADAARIKAAPKPNAAAWAVNQLGFREPKVLAALVSVGDRLRKPAERNEAMQARRDALSVARKKVEEILEAGGHKATPDVFRHVSSTLEAVVAFGSTEGRPGVGRLTSPLEAPGFDEIAALGLLGAAGVAGPAAPRLKLVPSLPAARPALAPVKKREPEARPPVPPRPNPKRERALEERRLLERKRLLADRARAAERARANLQAAEKKLETARKKQQELESALSQAMRLERKLREEVAAARKALEAADAAELAALNEGRFL